MIIDRVEDMISKRPFHQHFDITKIILKKDRSLFRMINFKRNNINEYMVRFYNFRLLSLQKIFLLSSMLSN